MTEVLFALDSEDYTANEASDAIVRYADLYHEAGIRAGFCVVGLVAKQLRTWCRSDVLHALRNHDVLSHSYGHTLHPTINEYTDIEDFDAAYEEVMRQETEGIKLLQDFFGDKPILGACPPGNQKSYVAMYAYADMGLPLYTDTYCDLASGGGTYYCNMYHISYTFSLGKIFDADEARMQEVLDMLAQNQRVVIYTHPQEIMFSEFWDTVNYYKVNKHPFGEWEPCKRRDVAVTESYYANVRKFVSMLKADKRFSISSYEAIYNTLLQQPARVVRKADVAQIKDALFKDFAPLDVPCSLSVADVFLAVREFLLGKEEHVCGKVYGFLDKPYAIEKPITLSAKDIVASAETIDVQCFLPTKIMVGDTCVGPADWLRAALSVLCGAQKVTIEPAEQLSSLERVPKLPELSLLGWMQSDDFKDTYLSNRLRLQAWTLRY